MAERQVTIASRVGLHARPATIFVKAVQGAVKESGAPVTIAKGDGAPVDASSILNVLTLNAGSGDQVVLRSEGEGAEQALDSLVELLQRDLDA